MDTPVFFTLLNKLFINVIWILFTLDGAFVCFITSRQENKKSLGKHKPG